MHWQAAELIDALAAQQRTGLIFVDEYGHRRDYTFAEVAAYSRRYAAVLRAFGVQHGDPVYVCLSRTAKCIFTLVALQRLGAQAILDEERAGGATTIVANRKYRRRIDETRERFGRDARYLIIGEEREGWARLDTLAQVAAASAPPPQANDAPSVDAARAAARERLGAAPTDVVWCAAVEDGAEWFERAIVLPWLCESTAVAHDAPFDALERLDLVRELDVTVLIQQAQEYHAELALPEPKRFKMPRLRRCVVIDGCEEQLQAQWYERFGVQLTVYAAA